MKKKSPPSFLLLFSSLTLYPRHQSGLYATWITSNLRIVNLQNFSFFHLNLELMPYNIPTLPPQKSEFREETITKKLM